MDLASPRSYGSIAIRLIRQRDSRALQQELLTNRTWLRPWEATNPDGPVSIDMRSAVRRLLQQYRDGVVVVRMMQLRVAHQKRGARVVNDEAAEREDCRALHGAQLIDRR